MAKRMLTIAALGTMSMAVGCGGDQDAGPEGRGDNRIRVTLTADSIQLPDEVPGGVVEVEFESQVDERESAFDLTRVTRGTTEPAFSEAIAKLVGGGPFPDFVQATVGVASRGKSVTTQFLELEPGDYVAWSIPEVEDDESEQAAAQTPQTGAADGQERGGPPQGPPPEAVVTKSFVVTASQAGELPETDGTITARDYTFDIDATVGERYTFRNTGPSQFHHVVLFDFGTMQPAVVEDKLPAFLEAGEDAPPPPEFEHLDLDNMDVGSSGVFPTGLAGTFSAPLKAGNTYAAVCFIHDKSGGPPHASAHQMWRVFTVS